MGEKKLSLLTKICFGIGAFGKDAMYAIVGTFLMLYLTDFRSVAPTFVGTLFMIARLWDAFNDPFMGMIVDNTKTRWGKFRPWIIVGTLLNALILIFLFSDINLSQNKYLIWCSVFYILWGMTNDVPDMIEVDPSTICQCTGLNDKNGKLIWENDIVRYTDMITGVEKIDVIKWNETYASFSRLHRSQMGLQYLYIDEFIANECEVIGSAIDNPELLEVGE